MINERRKSWKLRKTVTDVYEQKKQFLDFKNTLKVHNEARECRTDGFTNERLNTFASSLRSNEQKDNL